MKSLKKIFVIIFLVLCTKYGIKAQVNLVKNPSFEQLINCPNGFSKADTATYWNWINNITFTSNQDACKGTLLNSCCTSSNYCSEPNNWFGFQWPRTGNSYICLASIYSFPPTINNNQRDYLKGQLITTLQAGKQYCLTFYYNATNDIIYATNRFGAYIDNGTVSTYSCCAPMPVMPQAQNDTNVFMTDTIHWVKIQGSFTAIGNENTITLGNFVDSSVIKYQLFNSNGSHGEYYNIDDVSLIAMDLAPYAGNDTIIAHGDSAYIGRPFEVGINDDCIWYVLGNSAPLDTIAGMWVKPTTTTSYVVEQNICGTITYDTVKVSVNPLGIKSWNNTIQLLIYPNPSTGDIYINGVETNAKGLKIELYDISGRLLLHEIVSVQNGTIKLNTQLTNGVYQLCLISSDGTIRQQKLIITK